MPLAVPINEDDTMTDEAAIAEAKPPTAYEVFKRLVDVPLYEQFECSVGNAHNFVRELRKLYTGYDSYCPDRCSKEVSSTPWRSQQAHEVEELSKRDKLVAASMGGRSPTPPDWTGKFYLKSVCSRCGCTAVFHVQAHADPLLKEDGSFTGKFGPLKFVKFGQYPSLAAFHQNDLYEYRDVMKSDQKRDFSKAIGAASQGYTAGACTYLRRVWESILNEARGEHMRKNDLAEWKEYAAAQGNKARIKLLADELPDFMRDNERMYSLLSESIHNLPEEAIQEIYPQLREVMELIFDDRKTKIEEAKKRERLAKFIKQQDQRRG